MHQPSIAAIIPAFNEEKHVGDVVRRTRVQLDHVLVVDDGSTDQTALRARDARDPRRFVITDDRGRRPFPDTQRVGENFADAGFIRWSIFTHGTMRSTRLL